MASSLFLQHSNQVTSSVSDKIHGRSKTHLFLKKIIDIIISSRSSLQPCDGLKGSSSLNPKFESKVKGLRDKPRALLDIDLNLRLGPPPEALESENLIDNRGFSACSVVGEAGGKVCGIVIDCNSSVVSGDVSTVDKSSEGECDPKEFGNSSENFQAVEANIDEEVEKAVEEETREFSEITNLQARSSEIYNKRVCVETEDGETSMIKVEEEKEEEERQKEEDEERKLRKKEYKSDGYLGLLVEAARLISGNFEELEPEPDKPSQSSQLRQEATEESQERTEIETEKTESNRCRSKRNQCWMLDFYEGFEDISPIVRSKRGRNQVLPYRYRDSVLEPWKRLTRQRSTRVSNKQKPR